MSGLTSLIDTLLATRLTQRIDLVPLKTALEIAGPAVTAPVGTVNNDVRLPSRAALQQQLGVGLLKADQRGHGHGHAPARLGDAVNLSIAARAVAAILESHTGVTAKIVGTEPLMSLSKAQPVPPHLLAATLARTVASSGLFYESHLQQYAAGTRTLAQLLQEPQARLDAVVKNFPHVVNASLAAQGSGVAVTDGKREVGAARVPAAVATFSEVVSADLVIQDPGVSAADDVPGGDVARVPAAAVSTGAAGDGVSIDSGRAGVIPSSHSLPAGLAASAEPAQPLDDGEPIRLREPGRGATVDIAAHDAAGEVHGASTPDAARSSAPGLAGVHPEAIALVRQQLELLAVPLFRWGGEAWPGTPMDWEIHEERDERETDATTQAQSPTWSTRLVLTLPTLRDVEVRISLAGSTLQVDVAARENATLALLNEGRDELPRRLGDLGLQLTGLQIGAWRPEPGTKADTKDDDVL